MINFKNFFYIFLFFPCVSFASASQQIWSYAYNDLGLIKSVDGPRSDVSDITTYSYDAQGHLISVTNPLGHTTQLSNFDTYGNPQALLDANNVTTVLSYTPQGWLASISTVGSTTHFEYDTIGQITKVTRGDGSWLEYTWSAARRLVAVSNKLGEKIEFYYDAMGNRTAQRLRDVSNNITHQQAWVYDELGRFLRSVGAGGQTYKYGYDVNSNRTMSQTPKQTTTTSGFDALNRLVSSTDPLNGATQLSYDSQDNLTQVRDPRGIITRYEYDGLGNLTKLISPDSGATTYVHDTAGNVINTTDARGVVTAYTYDALNRLVLRQYPANPSLNVRYHYDMTAEGNHGVGRLTGIQDASGVIGYHYDGRGNLTEQLRSVQLSGADYYDSLIYEYDDANQLVSITYPMGFRILYARNSAGQISQVQLQVSNGKPAALASQIQYLPFGPLKSLTWANGLSLLRAYDQDYRLVSQQLANWNIAYSYDFNSNIESLQSNLFGNLSYGYDALDRLTSEKRVNLQQKFAYDAAGNRISKTVTPIVNGSSQTSSVTQYSYAASSNRLSQIAEKSVVSDAAGNLTQDRPERQLEYDQQNRLARVKIGGVRVAEYRYNALGQRTHKIMTGGTTVFLYGSNGQLLEERLLSPVGQRQSSQFYIWLDNLPIAGLTVTYNAQGAIASSTPFYLHSDHLNTPRLATNQSQQSVWQWQSDAFGVGQASGSLSVNLRFPGQYFDQETGLHYNYFRDYDPETGRYVESDPIGLQGGLNTYGYVEGNPVNFIDPLGLAKLGGTIAPPCVPGFEAMICSPSGAGGFGPMGGLRGGLSPQGELAYCPVPAGLGRSGALGSAKRDLGIPRAQHPDAVTKVPMTNRGGTSVLGLDGKPVMTREYTYTRPDGTKVVIQDHSAGHQFGQKGVGDQGPHFNVRPPENTRTGSVPGTQNHYSW
ncbi:RHS repeat-associated core domain-containing protein [Pseudomonas cuatrocienegasensis]|uniref:RHS repeat-associated core domain-containing protein n=1 Tax=Pseudomonas cuatrocienegasensis TaxID=543360 RepID=A0ABY1B3E3_9PSED|nr:MULTISPECIES: HNH/endonuclease VII fold putative polymorphic toxin [Pseudomonas]SEP83996.1 RHS repeat-associated core domain-containing protein [Pseudomonas cuatrocienegasensis]